MFSWPNYSVTSLSSAKTLFENFYSRRLLLQNPLHHPTNGPVAPMLTHTGTSNHDTVPMRANGFDVNIVMILAVLLCALVCALGLNSIIRCALRLSSRAILLSNEHAQSCLSNTGIKKEALKTFPMIAYSPNLGLGMPSLNSECAICLSDFTQGERVRVLPRCNHGFHVRCIDKWLNSHSSCPTCRQCLLETCQKIIGSARTGSLDPRPVLVPLDPEGLVTTHRTGC